MKSLQLQSDRLTLRLLDVDDWEFVHQLHSIPEVATFNTLAIPKNSTETKAVIAPWIEANNRKCIKNFTFIIQNNHTKKSIGLFGLKLGSQHYRRGEIWYKILPLFWNQGYATESVNLVLDYAFAVLKLHRVQAGCAVDNIGSIKVLEKVGMIREGRGRQVLPLASGWSDNFEYSILDSDKRKT